MAHSPEKKAAVIADILKGKAQREIAKDHAVSPGTVATWAVELTEQKQAKPSGELAIHEAVYQDQFQSSCEKLFVDVVNMLVKWAEYGSDVGNCKENPNGVHLLGTEALNRASVLLNVLRAGQSRKPTE